MTTSMLKPDKPRHQPKEGSKEAQLREMRKAGRLPKHAAVMLDDGAPPEIIRLGKEKPAAAGSAPTAADPPKRDFRIPKGMSTEEGNAMLAREAAEKKQKAYERINQLRESKGLPPMPAPKGDGATQAKADAKAETTESEVRNKKSTKKAASAKARTAVNGKTEGVKPGTKLAIIAGLLTRREGCTTADVLKATDWPAVSMPAQAKAAGLKLKKEKDGKVTRYRAA